MNKATYTAFKPIKDFEPILKYLFQNRQKIKDNFLLKNQLSNIVWIDVLDWQNSSGRILTFIQEGNNKWFLEKKGYTGNLVQTEFRISDIEQLVNAIENNNLEKFIDDMKFNYKQISDPSLIFISIKTNKQIKNYFLSQFD